MPDLPLPGWGEITKAEDLGEVLGTGRVPGRNNCIDKDFEVCKNIKVEGARSK